MSTKAPVEIDRYRADGGDVGGDAQVGIAPMRTFAQERADGTFTVITEYAYAERIAEDRVEDGYKYDVVNQTEIMHCRDLDDIGGSEITSETQYEHPGYFAYKTLREAESYARQYIRGLAIEHYGWAEVEPTPEQFDAAAKLGSTQALAEIDNGAEGPRETPLSGEWADEASPSRIAAAVEYTGTSDSAVDELCNAWERSYFDTWRHTQVSILCAGHTEDGEPCPFFIEVNSSYEDDPDNIAPWVHLTRGDEADDALEDHDATPGRVAALSWWKANGPERVKARFTEEV